MARTEQRAERARRWRRRRASPRAPWLAFVALAAVIVAGLLINGLVDQETGPSSTTKAGTVYATPGAGPVVQFSGSKMQSLSPPSGEVALTFDDGPDARYTPQILDVLARYHAHATFFVVGSRALRDPGLVRAELAGGNEVGSHTFTHADLGSDTANRQDLELGLTQTALSGAAGVNTAIVRLPYSSSATAIAAGQYRAAERLSRLGYLVVFATTDGEDWRRPGAARIVANALPPAGQGAVVMLHDGGGDRSQTVAATRTILSVLAQRHDRVVTVSQLLGQPRSAVDPAVTGLRRAQGLALLWAYRAAHALTLAVYWAMVPIALLAVARALLAVALARRHARRPPAPRHLPPVTALVPAYNEEVGIAATVRSLLASDYPNLEVVVIDDGSTDSTVEVVRALESDRVRLVTQPNSGKAVALATGLAACDRPMVVMLDGDTVFEPDTVARLVAPLCADPTVGAVSGNAKVGNRKGILGRWQHLEYVMGFNLDRRMADMLGCITTVPGAAGAFRREAIEAAGGPSSDTLAEDTDLTMAVQRAGWRVVYAPDARAWTEAPSSLASLWRQRYRWAYGTLQAAWKHRGAFREGIPLGRIGLPYIVFFDVVLPLLAPVIDLFALYGLIFLNPWPVLGMWLAFMALQAALAVVALRFDHESLRPLWVLPLQQFVYRQIMYLVIIQSVYSALAGLRLRWHKLPRTGLDPLSAPG